MNDRSFCPSGETYKVGFVAESKRFTRIFIIRPVFGATFFEPSYRSHHFTSHNVRSFCAQCLMLRFEFVDSSRAELDISSTNRGILIARTSCAKQDEITARFSSEVKPLGLMLSCFSSQLVVKPLTCRPARSVFHLISFSVERAAGTLRSDRFDGQL